MPGHVLKIPIGLKIGLIRVIGISGVKKNNHYIYYDCECICGIIFPVRSSSLKTQKFIKGCGCYGKIKPGQKINKLTVIKRFKDNNQWKWECLCECGNRTCISSAAITTGNTKTCGCGNSFGALNLHWKGYKELPGQLWNRIKASAKKRNIEFDLTKEYLWELYLCQDKKCSLSGVDLKLSATKGKTYRQDNKSYVFEASLDRIDNTKGYIEGNVQWVQKDINMMKHIHKQDDFVYLCQMVTDNKKNIRKNRREPIKIDTIEKIRILQELDLSGPCE